MSKDRASSVKFVVAGHATIDEIDGPGVHGVPRTELGGGVCYSSLCLASLDHTPNIVTRVGIDFPADYSNLLRIKAGLDMENWKSKSSKTSRFKIYLDESDRKFRVVEKCEDLTVEDFSACLDQIPVSKDKVVIINAVNGELSPAVVRYLTTQSRHVFVDSQSFTRIIDPNTGQISLTNGLDLSFLAGVEVLKADHNELTALTGIDNAQSAIEQLSRLVKGILITSGGGETMYYEDGIMRCRARPFAASVRDTIGAGDIILSSYAARHFETGDPTTSLEFATAASSLSTETIGVKKALLSRQEIMRRMHSFVNLQN